MDTGNVKKLPAARALFYGTRLDREQIKKPMVAIFYSHNEITPGHYHLDQMANYIKLGIAEAGGTGIRINANIC